MARMKFAEDKNVALWAFILLGFAAAMALIPTAWVWWVSIPLWIMAIMEIFKTDFERRNLIKAIIFGLFPIAALASNPIAPYFFGVCLWFWAIFIFFERDESEQQVDMILATPVIVGLLCMIVPAYAVIFIAIQYAIFGVLLLWRGRL